MLENLQYTDGKERDEIDQIEAREKLMGVDKISPFGTNNKKVLKRKLKTMDMAKIHRLAERTATRIYADKEEQDLAIIKAFDEWRVSNWDNTGSKTQEVIKVLAHDTLEEFEKKMRSKTLSELQEDAMKLGFTPSFDRTRLMAALKQEYLKRGA
jgi:hypothetical protein